MLCSAPWSEVRQPRVAQVVDEGAVLPTRLLSDATPAPTGRGVPVSGGRKRTADAIHLQTSLRSCTVTRCDWGSVAARSEPGAESPPGESASG